MASSDNISMAVFCDFENVALGVRDANYEKFDIKPVLERLLLKGSIVVKKAYCDWDRYKAFKAPMHEANFEMIEIPHVRQSGKNSADIRLVVDALDLCYTKSHVDTFVIISGDSDFSPLVSKLRENAKRVIGVGVKQSTSDLLVANCDEFIFYDDLVREVSRAAAKRKEVQDARKAAPQNSKRPTDDKRKEELEARKVQALEMVVETFDALISERGDTGKIWASLLKDTLKRRRPDFSETYYGFRTFGNLLEEAQSRGLFEFGRDEKSGTYVFRSANSPVAMPAPELVVVPPAREDEEDVADNGQVAAEARNEPRRRSRGGRNKGGGRGEAAPVAIDAAMPELAEPDTDLAVLVEDLPEAQAEDQPEAQLEDKPDGRRRSRGGRNKGAGRGEGAKAAPDAAVPDTELAVAEEPVAYTTAVAEPVPEAVEAPAEAGSEATAETPAAAKERRRAPRKPAARKITAAEADKAWDDVVAAESAPAPVVRAPAARTPAARTSYRSDVAPTPAPTPAPAPSVGYDDDEDDDTSNDVNGNVAEGTVVHKQPARPARKPAARSTAPRGRRPAKPKGSSEG